MTKLDDALAVFFVAVDAAFKPGALPATGKALQTAMRRLTDCKAGMAGHTVCTAGSCRCPAKYPGFDRKRMPPSTTHVRRRSCHPTS